jgi:hypothetical protein
MSSLLAFLSVIGLAVTGVVSSSMQQNVDALRSTTALACTFTVAATPTWVGGEAHVELNQRTLKFQILDINAEGGSARFADIVERVHIVARLAGPTLHFIDSRLDGTLAVTTVFAPSGQESKFRAVYSRTHYYRYAGPTFESVPEVQQAFGYCEPEP